MNRYLLWISLLIFTLITRGLTQTSSDQPQAPFVAAVPETSQWTITCKYAKTPPDPTKPNTVDPVPPFQLQQMQITKSGNLKRDICIYGNGMQQEFWYVDNLLFSTDETGKNVMVSRPDQSDPQFATERGDPCRSTGFTGVGWVKAKYFDRVVRFEKESCYHYVLKPASTGVLNEDLGVVAMTGGAEAWISVRTNLPVAYRMDNVTYVYDFSNARPSSLSLPVAVQSKLEQYRKMQ